MTDIDAADLAEDATYRLLNGVVTPRAIAWVSTLNNDGGVNLAPFSCFMYLSPKPPLVAISIGGRQGTKDTLANAERIGEFTINSVHEPLARPMVDSSRRYGAGLSEAKDLGIEVAPGRKVSVPRRGVSVDGMRRSPGSADRRQPSSQPSHREGCLLSRGRRGMDWRKPRYRKVPRARPPRWTPLHATGRDRAHRSNTGRALCFVADSALTKAFDRMPRPHDKYGTAVRS